MKVPDITGRLKSLPTHEPDQLQQRQQPAGEAKRQTSHGDELELSPLARHSVARLQEDGAARVAEASEAQIAEIRERVTQGFFNNPGVLSEIASRLTDFYSK